MQKAIIAVSMLFAASTSLWAQLISVEPVAPSVSVGDMLTLNVMISGATDLYAWQFDLGFDPTVLQAVSVSEGPFLQQGGATTFLPGTIDNVDGSIADNADILDGAISGVNGDGVLMDAIFQAIGVGSSNVQLFNVFALDSLGLGLNFSTSESTVTVTAASTPEPAGWVLLAFVLMLLAMRWRRLSPWKNSQ